MGAGHVETRARPEPTTSAASYGVGYTAGWWRGREAHGTPAAHLRAAMSDEDLAGRNDTSSKAERAIREQQRACAHKPRRILSWVYCEECGAWWDRARAAKQERETE